MKRTLIIITGSRNSGKTKLLSLLADYYSSNNFKISGLLSIASYENNQKTEYKLYNLTTDESITLCRIEAVNPIAKNRKYSFKMPAFKYGGKYIEEILLHPPDIFLFDEIGTLELNELGWYNDFMKLINSEIVVLIVSFRKNILNELLTKFNINGELIIDLDHTGIDKAFEDVRNSVKHY